MRLKIIIITAVLLLVLTLLIIIVPYKSGHIDKKSDVARFRINYLEYIIKSYNQREGNYPESLEELRAWFQKTSGSRESDILIVDPWDVPFHYCVPGKHNAEGFDLWTYGADNMLGGEGANKDIGNWEP